MRPTLTMLSSFTTLMLSGAKTTDFLQGQLTCDMRLLTQHGAHSLSAVCDHRGRMLANFWVVHWHDDFLLVLPRELCDSVKNHLQKYAVFSKVIMSQNDDFFIAELNHCLPEKNNNTVFISLPSRNRFLILSKKNYFANIKINTAGVSRYATFSLRDEGFFRGRTAILPLECKREWSSRAASITGRSSHAVRNSYTDETEWKKNNIADRLCILYVKTSLLFTPQMIGLEKLGGVSFHKGCFVGQEIIARTEYLGTLKRHLRQQQIQSDQPLFPGDPLKNHHDEPIGVVVEAVKLTENSYEILAVIRD